jgi:glucose/arabinose dehydrogenase
MAAFSLGFLVSWLMNWGQFVQASSPSLANQIKLPPGFNISIFTDKVPGARSLAVSPSGTVYVGTRGDKVYAILDQNKDYKADQVLTIASGLNQPNGVAFRDGNLYVAEIQRLSRLDNIESHLKDPPKPMILNESFPKDGHHGWKFIRFGPDGLLYIPVGAPCNICKPTERYAALFRLKSDGTEVETFGQGIRNTVGFDWDPKTKELWFTDNGRDWLGDDVPPDELNHAPKKGLHFGYPYCHGTQISDPEFGKEKACSETTPPVRELGPHVASLGMRFYSGENFPKEYRGRIFIAEHGSWNRSKPVGYRVTMVTLDGSKVTKYETFAEGWLSGRRVIGRPVDIELLADGSLLVSDDQAGAIYRISYGTSK